MITGTQRYYTLPVHNKDADGGHPSFVARLDDEWLSFDDIYRKYGLRLITVVPVALWQQHVMLAGIFQAPEDR